MLFNLLGSSFPKFVGLSEASLDAIIGFMVVFIGIIFLVFVVWLVGKILSSFGNKSDETSENDEKTQEPVPVLTTEALNEDDISEETVAVIMAALMAYYQTNQPKCEFTVKRIKRI